MKIWGIVLLSAAILANTATMIFQGRAIKSLIESNTASVEFDSNMLKQSQEDYTKLWDLHRRVLALENETKRLEAHIKWFVMRRSGTNELRKMEAAVDKLEKEENGV
jgi:hypothetical protein